MIVTIGGIPVYDAVIADDESGMMKISLVDDPAVMSNFKAFDSDKKMQMYSISDEEKRLVRGVIMRADFPIYRRDADLGEYYIIYKADTIRQMAEKYLVDGYQNNVNLMHQDDSDVEGVQMVQFFIKGDGVSVEGFDDCADGSLFGEFHIINDEVWDAIKEGTYKGFSLEGYFDLYPEQDKESVEEIVESLDGKFKRIFKHSNSKSMRKKSKLARAILSILAEFGNITTDKGILAWDGEDDLKEGDLVYIEDEEGNRTPAEDGDYKTDDNKTIVVVEGKVSEIRDPEAEVSSTDEEMGSKSTDKGDLLWNGEEDLKEGDEVFVLNADGEKVPAEDGDYVTEDNKVIKVTDGKVESITDKDAEVASDGEELKAKRLVRHKKVAEVFSESYNEKESKMYDALNALYSGSYPWIVDAGDDYCVAEMWDEESESYGLFRFPVTWNEDGTCTLGEKEEVKWQIVPADASSPWDAPTEEEYNALVAERDSLKAEVEKFKKTPAAKSAHEEVETSFSIEKTGDRKLDRLATLAAAARMGRK